ncbi:MAG TPA: hypothetical protein VJT31_36975 [Rugosimonospora sp.]|nr:hypothetical protein [Rugosimonospora sp.]
MKCLRVLLVVLLAVGAATGCDAKNQAGSGAPSSAASAPSPTPAAPTDALLASVKAFGTTSYKLRMQQSNASATGEVDPTAKAAQITATGTVSGQHISVAYTVISPEVWTKIDLGATLNKQLGVDKATWMHIDRTKVTGNSQLPVNSAGEITLGTSDLLAGVANVQHPDSTHYTGTVDVTNTNSLLSPDKDALAKAGEKAKAVPFTATLDDQGHLTSFKEDGATIDPALTAEITFTDFGAPMSITKPAGAVEAPAAVYQFLNA